MAQPVLKWVGGKFNLLPKLKDRLPPDYAKRLHVEPFAGGASLFFGCEPKEAWLSDTNDHLMDTYQELTWNYPKIVEYLAKLQQAHKVDATQTYYTARTRFNNPETPVTRKAALMIYLNKTCFNGLYRVNKKGEFNAAIGDYTDPPILDGERLEAAHMLLRQDHIGLFRFDFEDMCDMARVVIDIETDDSDAEGVFVYLDPPYDKLEDDSFTGYTTEGFTREDQARLFSAFHQLDKAGAKVMLSNAATPFIKETYQSYNIEELSVARSVSRDTDRRGRVGEVIIRNYGI